MKFHNCRNSTIGALERNKLLEETKQFSKRFGVKDVAVIEGDVCSYVGKRPQKTTKVNWPQEVR